MRYRMHDGTIVDTRRAKISWGEKETGKRERSGTRLYRSRRSRYYVEYWSDTAPGRVEWVSPEEAIRWMNRNSIVVPEDLKIAVASTTEVV